jgi:hypothetical protein
MLSYLWGGSKFVKQESEDFVEAMKSDLKDHGEFQMNFDGTMEFRDLLVMRSCISRQVARSLVKRKEELLAEQHEHYIKGEDQEYRLSLRKYGMLHQKRTIEYVAIACEFIGYD